MIQVQRSLIGSKAIAPLNSSPRKYERQHYLGAQSQSAGAEQQHNGREEAALSTSSCGLTGRKMMASRIQ
jgi:hypothetical protein